MGYKDKDKYHKDLHQQVYDRLKSMQAFGESKKKAIENGTDKKKIFSFKTFKTYFEHSKYFVKYIKKNHPECGNLKQVRKYVNEWLQSRVDQGLSAWTVHLEAKALGKLFGISPEDPDYFKPPQRKRCDIVRSRIDRVRDKHFSKSNNAELIKFCKGVGARREGLTKMRGRDLLSKDQIIKDIDRIISISKERKLTPKERSTLKISKDALLFEKSEYFVYLREKGGRERIAPIVGPDTDAIVERIRGTAPDDRVFQHVHTQMDIHGYRSDYSNFIYKQYARPIETIPYDKVHKGTGNKYQSQVYHCRKDEKGRELDRQAMLLASKALGHNRIDIVANNYLRGL